MIRKACLRDMETILGIYACARNYMRRNGNPSQWTGGYPSEELLLNDIAKGQLYVVERQGGVHGVFVYFSGEEPTYSRIDGEWMENSGYGVIHRIASDGKYRGILHEVLAFTGQGHIRADTHRDNSIMQKKLEEEGFSKRGIIYLENGDPRLAYERVRAETIENESAL